MLKEQVVGVKEARDIADEVLRVIVTNQDIGELKDFVARELDITDEILDNAVEALFSKSGNITLDAKKYSVWIHGISSVKTIDTFLQYKTLWDIPFTYLPEYVFASGFELARQHLPSDGSGIQIAHQGAKELKISWINLPGGS